MFQIKAIRQPGVSMENCTEVKLESHSSARNLVRATAKRLPTLGFAAIYLMVWALCAVFTQAQEGRDLRNSALALQDGAETQPELPQAPPPNLDYDSGTYYFTFTVAIYAATPGYTFYYTTNGETPTTKSTEYRNPIPVISNETIKAIAVKSGFSPSNVVTATYTIIRPEIETDIVTFFGIAPYYAGGNFVTVSHIGVVAGAPPNSPITALGNAAVANAYDPDSSDGLWDKPASFVGGGRLRTTSDSFTDAFFLVNQGKAIKLYGFTRTTVTDPAADTAQLTVEPTNSEILPFTKYPDGAFPTISLLNTGSGIVAIAENSAVAYFIPTSGAKLGKPVALAPEVKPVSNARAMWIDLNDNVGVVSGTGTNAVLNLYDKKGDWLLSGSGELVAPNAQIGLNASVVPADDSIAIHVSSDISRDLLMFYVKSETGGGGTEIEYVHVRPASTAGGKPTVTQGEISNPNGTHAKFGTAITLISGAPTESGLPRSVFILDQQAASMWEFSVDSASSEPGTLSFTETGHASLPIHEKISIGQSSVGFGMLSDTDSEGGFYFLPKVAKGNNLLGEASLVGAGSPPLTNSTLQTDISGNFGAQNNVGDAVAWSFYDQYYVSEVVCASGVSSFALNPSIGSVPHLSPKGTGPC